MVEQGYTAFKFDPFGDAYKLIGKQSERLAIEIVGAVREAVGWDVDLCIEAHDRFTVGTAIRLGRQLEEFKPMWLETPVRTYDIAGHIEVARAINVPVVLGEGFKELRQFADLLSASRDRHRAAGAGDARPLAWRASPSPSPRPMARTWPAIKRRAPSARP